VSDFGTTSNICLSTIFGNCFSIQPLSPPFFFSFSLFVSARQSIMPLSKISFNFLNSLVEARVNKKEANV
jgi:hypothetical protein